MTPIKCPRCGQPSEYSPKNLYRPFCSKRCQLIDLGQWADEIFTIPSEEVPDLTQIRENEPPIADDE